MRVPAVLLGFSQAAAQCPMAQFLLYKGVMMPWGEAKACRQAYGLPALTCTSKKDGVQITYLMLQKNVGHS